MQDKIERLELCMGDRLLVVGGSNVAFGIHSPQLQQATGMETVNLGLHASLGLDYAVECVHQHVRQGDVVVLIPEYELLIGGLQQGDPALINQLLQQCPTAARYFDQNRYSSWKHFLDRDALCQLHQWVMRACQRIGKREKPDNIYQRSSFNLQGDVVAHYGRTIDAEVAKPLPDVDAVQLQEAVNKLNRLARHCRQRGAEVYLTFPPLPESTYARSTQVVHDVQETLRTGLEIPILHRPEEFVFPSDHFFDTAYHLSEAAGEKRTRAVATALIRMRNETRVSSRTDAGQSF